MPRRASVPDDESTVPSAPRVVRTRRKRVQSEEVVSSDADERVEVVTETRAPRPRRKAPIRRVAEAVETDTVTPAATSLSRRPQQSRLSIIVMVLVFLGAIGASAALGFSDKGTIDVAAKLQEQSQIQANVAGEQSGTPSQVVPVQNTPVSLPNGGLQGRGIESGVAPAPVVPSEATTTATSSDSTASTTPTNDVGTEDSETSEAEAPTEVPQDATESGPTTDPAAR